MIKDRIITIFLALVIIILLIVVGIFGYKVVVEGYTFDEVVGFLTGNSKEESKKDEEQKQPEENVVEQPTDENILLDQNAVLDGNELSNQTTGQELVDISELKNYAGTSVNFEVMKQLVDTMTNYYSAYLTNGHISEDTITVEFAKNVEQAQVDDAKRLLNDYIVARASEQVLGSFNISFSIGPNGNEVLTITKNITLEQ